MGGRTGRVWEQGRRQLASYTCLLLLSLNLFSWWCGGGLWEGGEARGFIGSTGGGRRWEEEWCCGLEVSSEEGERLAAVSWFCCSSKEQKRCKCKGRRRLSVNC